MARIWTRISSDEEREMTKGTRFVLFAVALLMLAPFAKGQDDAGADQVPLSLGDFTLSGSGTAGFRFVNVKGNQPQYQEMFDLSGGFRLLDFSLNGDAQEGKNPFADHFSLQVTSLGGDPFPTAQFAISKNKVYDFRVDWRQDYYFWNQNDNVVLPIANVASGLSTGLTSNHNWATVRKFGSMDFTLHATNNLRFRFNYYRPSDEGMTYTTESPDFFDSPSYWGTYARANAFYLFAPLSDYTNRFTGGIDYSYGNWSFHYDIGYQTFTENISLDNVSSPELSIDPVASSVAEPLTNFSGSEFRKLTTPISEFTFVGKPLSKLEWRGGYTYYKYTGPATFNQTFNGTAPGSTGTLGPFSVIQSARAMVVEPNNIITMGLTYHAWHWLSLVADYKYSRFTSDSTGNYQSLLNGTTSATGTTTTRWEDGLSEFTFSMDFTPSHALVIRPGIQLTRSNVESLTDGVVDPEITLTTNIVRPAISFGYEPSKKISVRGDFHTTDTGASYTAMTPHTGQSARFVVRYHPIEKLTVEDAVNVANNKLVTTDFVNNVRANAITVSYSLGDRFSVFGSFSYDSYYAQGDVDYPRGTAPVTDFLRDQEINRVWSGGIEGKPTKSLGLRLSGNFDRSTGVGQILGIPAASSPATYNEPPAYGPLKWPLVTGTVYYDLPRAGRLAIDLQRTYYSEEIVRVNNFSANLLTIRWTKGF
jgi:hypothetical protein